jgi:cation:H+ antiporter
MPAFTRLGLWANLGLFVVAAATVWFAGGKLSRYAKTISDRTRAGQAFIGILLVGSVVSLPELATTVTSAAIGDAPLAVNTLLGGVAAVMVIVALTDALTGPEPLSSDITQPVVLFQGVLVILLMTIAAAGMVVGDVAVLGVGLWTSALFGIYLLFVLFTKIYGARKPWVAQDPGPNGSAQAEEPEDDERRSTARISVLTALASIAILIAGFLLAVTGEALGEISGIGSSFIGLMMGGIATSLPEISTTLAAVRLRQYEMAFADAFGTNLFSTMLLFASDVVYRGGPVLNEAGPFALFATLLGIVLTTIYMAGFVRRSHRAVLRMGIDSLIVIVVYLGGVAILFSLRSG